MNRNQFFRDLPIQHKSFITHTNETQLEDIEPPENFATFDDVDFNASVRIFIIYLLGNIQKFYYNIDNNIVLKSFP